MQRTFPLTSIDIAFVERELQGLIGARLTRVYAFEKNLVLVFTLKSEGKRVLDISLPNNVCFLGQKQDTPDSPTRNTLFLRKHLEGSFLESVKQQGFDRILRLRFSGVSPELVLELFSRGNWLLLDAAGIILGALQEEEWKDRSLKKGLTYVPPHPAIDIRTLDSESLHQAIRASSKDSLVKALAVDLGVGGVYAEEFCVRANLDKHLSPLLFSTQDAFSIHSSLKQLLLLEPRGYVYLHAITPVPLVSAAESMKQELDSFLEARVSAFTEKTTYATQELEKAKLLRIMQEENLASLRLKIDEHTKQGEWLYEHYQIISELLRALKEGSKDPATIERLLQLGGFTGSFDASVGILTIETDAEHPAVPETEKRGS